MRLLMILPLALIGGFLYRWRGGGFFPHPPRPIPQLLFALFPALIMPSMMPVIVAPHMPAFHIGAAALAFILSVAAECMGHGNFQDLGTWKKPTDPERIEVLFSWLKPRLSAYAYDAVGMSMTGLIATVWPGLYLAYFHLPWTGALLGLSGALKGPGYMLGRYIADHVDLTTYPTVFGEFLSGALRWAVAALIFALL